jgi:hypothetical protein
LSIFFKPRCVLCVTFEQTVGGTEGAGSAALNNSVTTTDDDVFFLRSNLPGEHEEAVMLAIVKDMDTPTDRLPLQCVTFKLALPEYFLLKKLCQRWKLKYTIVIRIFLRIAISVLESPTGELLELLEKHRESEIEKDRLRKEARNKRFAQYAA